MIDEQTYQIVERLGLELYPHTFGRRSREHLRGVMPGLVSVAELAIQLCSFDGTVPLGGGLRSQAQAEANAASGTGIVESRHRVQPDGFGHAIDLVALTKGRINWQNLEAFRAMARAVKTASAILEIPIRQGSDWNMNGKPGEIREWDWPHFEDPIVGLLGRAEAEMRRFRKELGL